MAFKGALWRVKVRRNCTRQPLRRGVSQLRTGTVVGGLGIGPVPNYQRAPRYGLYFLHDNVWRRARCRDGTLPSAIQFAVPDSNCLWFRDIEWDCHDLCSEVLEIERVIGRGDAGPVLLVPHNLDYPGLDGVLVWQQAGVWKALLIQATLSPRHAGSTGSRAVIAFWIACLESQGVQRDNIGLLFCPKPEDHLYRHEQAGDLGVAQYSMSWTPGAVNGKRTPAEALHSIDEYFRYGGVEVSGRFAC